MRKKLFVVFLLLAPLAQAQVPTVWVEPSLARVGQTQAAGSGLVARISAAKGEYESFQVVVRHSLGLSVNNLTVSPLAGPNGATIPATAYTLFREHYVLVSPSSSDGSYTNGTGVSTNKPLGAGLYPDPLIPFVNPDTGAVLVGAQLDAVPVTVAANINQPFFVDVLVPRTAAAGLYTGTFTVLTNRGNVTGQVELTVYNFSLPIKPALRSSFQFWTVSDIASHRMLLQHRLQPIRVPPSQQAALLGVGLGEVGLPFQTGANNVTCRFNAAPSVAAVSAEKAQHDASLRKYVYTGDELQNCPDQVAIETGIKQWGANLHGAGVEQLTVMPPRTSLLADVDTWVILPLQHSNGGAQDQARAAGRLWSYNSLTQDCCSPKWMIDYHPLNFRLQPGFLSQALGLKGLLYWRVDKWDTSADIWNNVNNVGVFSSNNYPGDGMLVYPGAKVGIPGVAPSMRLKWLRDGVDDYDYVELAKTAGKGAEALAIVNTVAPNWTNWTRDTNLLMQKRDAIAALLDAPAPIPIPPTPPVKKKFLCTFTITEDGILVAPANCPAVP